MDHKAVNDWFWHLMTWPSTKWMGYGISKSPLDLFIYQEIIHETKPDVLIELGTENSGSAFFFANVMQLEGRGRVVTVDINGNPDVRAEHERITYLYGDSSKPETLEKVRSWINPGERVMVSQDGAHDYEGVLADLLNYGPLVSPGCYLVVEDTNNIPGPMDAAREFLRRHPEFIVDESREKYVITFAEKGWLKRGAAA